MPSSPFPGMDPYLEHPALWPDVHNRLITAIADQLAPLVAPRYYVALERRTYLLKPDDVVFIGRPDVAVVQRSEHQDAGGLTASAGPTVLEVDVPMSEEVEEVLPGGARGLNRDAGHDSRALVPGQQACRPGTRSVRREASTGSAHSNQPGRDRLAPGRRSHAGGGGCVGAQRLPDPRQPRGEEATRSPLPVDDSAVDSSVSAAALARGRGTDH